MSAKPYPLLFTPVYKSRLWGGDRISRLFNRGRLPGPCAESWELTDRPDGMSVVVNGPLAGWSLHDLVASMKHDLTGTASTSPVFPLLIKILDASQRLSLQVHPDDPSAAGRGGEPKTEMWYVLAADPGAMLYAGLRAGAKADSFVRAVEQGHVESLLGTIPARPGTAIYLPGGLVHAIGQGCLLLEVQQNSDTTYRVHDWGRVDRDGKPRETHLEQALRVINWGLSTPETIEPKKVREGGGNSVWEVLSTPYFHMTRLDVARPEAVTNDGRSFHAIFVATGAVGVEGNGVIEKLAIGASCLFPASLREYTLRPIAGPAAILSISLV